MMTDEVDTAKVTLGVKWKGVVHSCSGREQAKW